MFVAHLRLLNMDRENGSPAALPFPCQPEFRCMIHPSGMGSGETCPDAVQLRRVGSPTNYRESVSAPAMPPATPATMSNPTM